jgi:acyl transferase domain-containing protein/thioesterase domain-containing protein/acyl carrier protein
MTDAGNPQGWGENDVAIVGMAAHLPGAASVEQYWENLRDGVESIVPLSEQELLAAGESPSRMRHRNYVASAAKLEGFEQFDAEFFGLSPKEAAIMDPQHRQFLEVSWEALENAGHMPENFDGPIGVFAGCGMGSYFYFNVCSNADLVKNTGMFLLRHTGNDKDFLSTRLSHFLDLRGPSVNVQTACSTSLVAAHYGCQALLNGECDMVLAGGVTIELPQGRGYVFQEGEILSPDGHCHAFDHRAQGTVFGSGAGVVVLRRMQDALADGDHIWGVIRGTAVNNDGSDKAGYLAPSVSGQAAAIAEAQAVADVSADTIDYVECHGTGTYLGDPIEVTALTEAFRETTDEAGFCRIGSVKTNIGHLDTAAGAASLIKTSLSLHHRQIPATLGYEAPNPAIEFEGSPFVVNDRLSDWVSHKGPRRAGVNSLGVGGTNAHVVLQEAPARAASEPSDWPFQLLTVSGRNRKALDANAAALVAHLRAHPEQDFADIAWTLKEGRRAFEKRRVVVAGNHAEAADLLEGKVAGRVFDHDAAADAPDVVFMFPGGGAQYTRMAQDLYETEPVFQEWMDRGLDVLQAQVSHDVRALWLGQVPDADVLLKQPSNQLPLIMIVEYALAQLCLSWGVTPAAVVGHSMGENTAACLAGVMRFEDCIGLVLLRGQLMDSVPAGGMLSVPLSAPDVEAVLAEGLHGGVDIASVNAPTLTVVSGPDAALIKLADHLQKMEVETQRVPINIAAHSAMLDPVLEQFRAYLVSIPLAAPTLPIISNRTGKTLSDAEAQSPDYWVQHLRNAVRFADCMATLTEEQNRVYLEVGPGKTLSSLARMQPKIEAGRVINLVRHMDETVADDVFFMTALGRLWACDVAIDWDQIWGEAARQKVVLPTYAFQRSSYFIEPGQQGVAPVAEDILRSDDLADWGYRPVWKPALAQCELDVTRELHLAPKESWLIFRDEAGVGADLAAKLRGAGHDVVEVSAGDGYGRRSADHYVLAPERGREGYDRLLSELIAEGRAPGRIVHMWLLTERENFRPGSSFLHRNLEQGFYSLMFLMQAMTDENLPRPVHITCVTSGAVKVREEALSYPEKATVLGPILVAPRELPQVSCAVVDVDVTQLAAAKSARKVAARDSIVTTLIEEILAPPRDLVAAIRGEKRFERVYRSHELNNAQSEPRIKAGGTYAITGGFGGIGLTLAEEMLRRGAKNIVLIGRSGLPERDTWHEARLNPRYAHKIKAVEKLEALGGEVMCTVADVCNLAQMQAVVAAATARFGAINGVIHAAGVVDDAPLLTKHSASVEDVLAPKLHGTQILDRVLPDGTLDWLVLFSSTSTAIAPAGQIDYVAANAYLNAFADSRAGGKTQVMALNWGIWSGVGMAAAAVADGTQSAEVLAPIEAAILQEAGFDKAGHRVVSTHVAQDFWVLDQHRTKDGTAIWPGTGYIELIAEALAAQGEQTPYEIRDLIFLRPFIASGDEPRELRVTLRRSAEGYDVQIVSACTVTGRAAHQLHVEATVALGDISGATPVALDQVAARCGEVVRASEGTALPSLQEAHLTFGPHWQVLRAHQLGEAEGLAELWLDAGLDATGAKLHPGLLDIATGWAMGLIEGYSQQALWVPLSYGALRVYGDLPARVHSWVRLVSGTNDAGVARFDVTLMDEAGRVCLTVEALTIKRLEDAFAPQELRAIDVTFVDDNGADGRDGGAGASPAEDRLRHNLAQGIRPKEGAEMFARALDSGLSQVVVSSMSLPELMAQASAMDEDAGSSGQSFERPELDTDFVAPETDVQRTLAGFWQELLGVETVGVEDSFFDLGGHSLIAVRLFSMVKKAYRVEFPISILFEAPTIEKCAALIEARLGPRASTDDVAGGAEAAVVPLRRFTHLVPMHQRESAEKAPFFLVAGMFGNVLNLRHLAHLLGEDRPFYGLQARGLFGDAAPHDDLAEAARDYIREIQMVQPKGPYFLGGFSGGGITAYEIARQFEAMGETVALVVMLDTPLPQRRPLSFGDRMHIQVAELKRRGIKYPFQWLRNRVAWEIAKRRMPEDTGEQDSGPQFHNAEIEAAFLTAVEKYELCGWDGRLELFRPPLVGHWQVGGGRSVDQQRAYVFEDNDWGDWVPSVRVTEVPGDHDSMVLEPNVRVLAVGMARAIAEAEQDIAARGASGQAAE